MENATFYGKRYLCYTETSEFTDYQGIGSDPLYQRYESVKSVLHNYELDESFLALPHYEEGHIQWYIDDWKEDPVALSQLDGAERGRYEALKEQMLNSYRTALMSDDMEMGDKRILAGVLKFATDERFSINDFIYCHDGKIALVAWGMRPDTEKFRGKGEWIKGMKIDEKFVVRFDAGLNGKLVDQNDAVIHRSKGYKLSSKDIPAIIADEGYQFRGWDRGEPIGSEISGDTTFIAQYNKVVTPPAAPEPEAEEQEGCEVKFNSGLHGHIEGGEARQFHPVGYNIAYTDIPKIVSDNGYLFIGWNPSNPVGHVVEQDIEFTAEYDVKPTKKKRGFGRVFFGGVKRPWLRRLLRLLTTLLLLALLSLLLRNCRGCSHSGAGCTRHGSNTGVSGGRGSDLGSGPGAEGAFPVFDNGEVKSITGNDGSLPIESVVAPVKENGGLMPPTEHKSGSPDIITNRLNIFFDKSDADLNQWSKEFKALYPGEEYKVIGYDENVPLIQIQIPENSREKVKGELNAQMPNHEFFVVDESIITLKGQSTSGDCGWHIDATNLKQAWQTTQGGANVIIAVVDDGIETTHPMLKGRFYKAYNVFTKERKLSLGVGHGTHVAGLAAGSDINLSQGIAGVAPKCKIMPVQVFDNGVCPFSALSSGIMYAIHNGADVVNISVAPSFAGMDKLPADDQKQIASDFFKEEERVYRHIIKAANEANVILVFAAGNDNILTAILPECRAVGRTINVAAVDPNRKAADFTNYADGANISAPGVGICSSFPRGETKSMDGTSMAAPIVSGTIALMRSIKPDLTVSQALAVLKETGVATDNTVPPMLLIDKAVEAVKAGRIPQESGSKDALQDMEKDDLTDLLNMLKELQGQRDEIDSKIKQIEQKLK